MRAHARAAALFSTLALAATLASGAESPTIGVELEPRTIAVGDPVVATLTLKLGATDAPRETTFPDWSKGWGKAEVLEASPVERTIFGEGVQLVQRLRLTAFEPGTVALPPVEVRLAGEPGLRILTPPSLALEVRSVIPADDKELKPAPPALPRALTVPRSFWWTLATGGALAVLAALLAWRNRPGADPLAAPELSPLAELERALALLAAEPPAGAFAHLSQALRRYLGRRLGFRALESTTTEVQRRLATQRFEPAFVQRTVRLLRLADQVKFAQRPAGQEEATARIAEARELAGAIENRLAPAPTPSPATPTVPPVPPVGAAPGAVGSPAAGAGGAA